MVFVVIDTMIKDNDCLPLGSYRYIQMVGLIYSRSIPTILGNLLEWLDFGIYGYSQAELSKAFFHDSITMAWIAFGLGYSVRPLGAHVLGVLADRTSRTLSLAIAVMGMTIATAGLALLPATCDNAHDIDDNNHANSMLWWTNHYCVSSVYATAIPAILFRCLQGFSAGASAGGVNVIQSEEPSSAFSPSQSVGVNNVSGAAASMLSAGLVYALQAWLGPDAYALWGWRLAFGLVVPLSIFAVCLLLSESRRAHDNTRPRSQTNECKLEFPMVTRPSVKHWSTADSIQNNSAACQGDDPGRGHDFSQLEIPHTNFVATSYSLSASVGTAQPMVSMRIVKAVSIYIQFAISAYNNLNVFLVQYATTELGFDAETATLLAVVGKALQLLLTPFAAALANIFG